MKLEVERMGRSGGLVMNSHAPAKRVLGNFESVSAVVDALAFSTPKRKRKHDGAEIFIVPAWTLSRTA